jgi:ABC-type polysaccharide/polyol phosphate transport system ATPase subunit
MLHFATGGRLNKNHTVVQVEALKAVTFSLTSGDRLGLIGHNGAGKTTLLKVLGQIYEPTAGSLLISGRTHCLFDLMVGLDQGLTGHENILLKGFLLGLSKRHIEDLIPSIEEFAGIGDFIKMPLRSYSAGMMVRLAFGIMTSFPSEILLIDEVMGVGDAQFIEKAQARMKNLIHESEIMVLSTHDSALIKKFCNKVLHLIRGEVAFFGPVEQCFEANSLIINKI